jgi:hypothetical protein
MVINTLLKDVFIQGYMIAGLSSRNFVLFEDERILPIELIEELQLFYVARLPQQVQRISETLQTPKQPDSPSLT